MTRHVGESLAAEKTRVRRGKAVCVGVAPWGVLDVCKALEKRNKVVSFIYEHAEIEDGSSQQSVSSICKSFSNFEAIGFNVFFVIEKGTLTFCWLTTEPLANMAKKSLFAAGWKVT